MRHVLAIALLALSTTSPASTKPQRPPVYVPVYVPVCNTGVFANPWKCSAPIRVKVAMGPRK